MATECWCLEIRGRAMFDYNQVNLHWQLDGVTASDQLVNGDNLTRGWRLNMETAWLDMFPDGYSLERLVAYRVKPPLGPQCSYLYQEGANAGTFGSGFMSNGLCPSIRLIPPLNTLSAGKCFLPVVPTGGIIDNALQAGYITAIEDFFDLAITGFSEGTATCNLAIYSRKLDSYSLAVGFTASPVLGFQRRRQVPL